MIEIGRVQTLKVTNIVDFGIFLDAETDNRDENVLLPKRFVPENAQIGDEIEVFVYKDSEDRIIATTETPKAQVGELAYLKVVDQAHFGAFLDIGLGRDVLLPHKEQNFEVKKGKKYLVKLYIDKTERLCATTKIYESLEDGGEYEKNQEVTGVVYAIKEGVGLLVAIDMKYRGLVPEKEYFTDVEIGDLLSMRVIRVREDGKIDLSTRKLVADQLVVDAEVIYSALLKNDGFLALNDKSAPEAIQRTFKMSKKAFKRAVGRLMRDGKVEQDEKGITKKEQA